MKEPARIGWGLIGIGRHADRFVAPAIRQSMTGELVAVFSRDRERGGLFAERHGCPSVYDSLEALLEDERVTAVFIGSPNGVHREQVVRAALAGKHVLCEKPMATTVEDCLVMVEACRQAGVRLGVGFHLRHNPVHVAARDLVSGGEIGKPLFAEAQYMHVTAGEAGTRPSPAWRSDRSAAGGGAFIGSGVHAVDLLRFVLRTEVSEVAALADANWASHGVERLVQVSARLQTGELATLSAGPMKYPSNHLILHGTVGTLRCTGSIGNYGGGHLELLSEQGTSRSDFDRCDVYLREVDAFAESIRAGTEPNASGIDGLRAAEVTEGVYESLRTRGMAAITPSAEIAAEER